MNLENFVEYCKNHIKGYERGEAQIFLDRFFTALGYAGGLIGAGASCEYRIKNEVRRSTSFADLVWKPIVLIEMKKRGEDLSIHYQQAFTYWTQLVPNRPQYVILCNFDEFWIYDLNINIYEPLEKIALTDLPNRIISLSFLLPEGQRKKPIFNKDKEDVTINAAQKVATVFNSIVKTRTQVSRDDAMRFCLQCILAMYAEDIDLLPNKIFTRLIAQCADNYPANDSFSEKSRNLIGGLFEEMNREKAPIFGLYEGVDYFNGGLFEKVVPLPLRKHEVDMLLSAATKNWKNVNPAIFGTIFQQGMEKGERSILGAHYTFELDIKKIIDPVLVQPWNEKIDSAQNLDELYSLLIELSNLKILDPSCGSGNFLFIAFKEMKLLERKLLSLVRSLSKKKKDAKRLSDFLDTYPFVNIMQFYGYDKNPIAVELAKVTLMIAKEMAWKEHKESYDNKFKALPLDNLDSNILCIDAVLNDDGTQREWIDADIIVGNPPYQSKNKMQELFGVEYMNTLRNAYPNLSGMADYCVYWFYKAHQTLKEGGYAGLVGTNTIRQNESRESGLDYIVNNRGDIFNAVSSQKWSGEAAVFVSIVNWKKGRYNGKKYLFFQEKDASLTKYEVKEINSSLSLSVDVKEAKVLVCNTIDKKVFLGQTHGHKGFLLTVAEANKLLDENKDYADVLKPFLGGKELVSSISVEPKRYVIDFTRHDVISAGKYKDLLALVRKKVYPDREKRAIEQETKNNNLLKQNSNARVNGHHIIFFNYWWKHSYGREDLLDKLAPLKRYIACSRVSLRPIFEFISSDINPSDALQVFCFDDDYSFGIIQSSFHWEWWKAKCSTLGEQFRYTANTVWDTFPFPQSPTQKQIKVIAEKAIKLRDYRIEMMNEIKCSLRNLYITLESKGKNPLRELHEALDKAVAAAYLEGNAQTSEKFSSITSVEILPFLLELNLQIAAKEAKGETVTPPGLPSWAKLP